MDRDIGGCDAFELGEMLEGFEADIIIYNPTMELGGVLVPTYRNRVVIFGSLS